MVLPGLGLQGVATDTLGCGHVARASSLRACAHVAGEELPDYHRLLTGRRVEYDIVCPACAETGDTAVGPVCEDCAERLGDDHGPQLLGWIGRPEVVHRDEPVEGAWHEVACSARPVNDRCVAPLPEGWLVLTTGGLTAVGADGHRELGRPDVVQEPPHTWAGHVRGPAVHTSPDGRYAAVATDYGSHGSVVDLADGSVVLRLRRDEYHPETTPFPVAFLPGRDVVVAATAWNRIGAFELPSGRPLTEGGAGKDYFHGALLPSPSGRWLLDDGWIWAPAGRPWVHDVEAWLSGGTQPWTLLTQRWYAWDRPTAWIDDDTVAVQGLGHDDEHLLDGVELYDVRVPRRTGMFAGPAGPMWAHDGQLYVAAENALEVWDPAEGARIGRIEGFRPVAHDPRTGAFAAFTGEALRTWSPRRGSG